MSTAAILQLIMLVSEGFIKLTPQVLALIASFKTAVNTAPGTPEHTAAVEHINSVTLPPTIPSSAG